ncbi:MAG: hypothetical protein ABIO39_07970 [Caulobacteraceae bacterium]
MDRIATAANSTTTLKPGTNRRLLQHVVVGLLLAAVAYAVCSLLIQAAGRSPAGDPAERTERVMQLLEPVRA